MTETAASMPDPLPQATASDPEEAVMMRNGITRVRADQYHVDGYRYTNLGDAMAQVARGAHARTGR